MYFAVLGYLLAKEFSLSLKSTDVGDAWRWNNAFVEKFFSNTLSDCVALCCLIFRSKCGTQYIPLLIWSTSSKILPPCVGPWNERYFRRWRHIWLQLFPPRKSSTSHWFRRLKQKQLSKAPIVYRHRVEKSLKVLIVICMRTLQMLMKIQLLQ